MPGRGPQFTSSFAEAQRRLLGETVFCAENDFRSRRNIYIETAGLIVDIMHRIKDDLLLRQLCHEQAHLRLGKKGGTKRIADSINDFIIQT